VRNAIDSLASSAKGLLLYSELRRELFTARRGWRDAVAVAMLRPTPTMARPIGVAAPAGSPRGAHPPSLPVRRERPVRRVAGQDWREHPSWIPKKNKRINELNEILADGESA
jgi:hypothetical protein